jgi:hypothetical protein
MDPREVQFTEQRCREQARQAAGYRLSQEAGGSRPRLRFMRPLVVWTARLLIRVGVRLFVLSKAWEQRGNPVYNGANEWEPLAVEAAAD